MALIVETGAIVANADTFATVDELRAYAAKRGATVPAGDEACEVLLIKAMDYLQAQEQRLKGWKVQEYQPLAWPRVGVVVDRYELPLDEIPRDVKSAQMQLAIDAQTIDLQPIVDVLKQTGPVIEKTVDVITTKYAAPVQGLATSRFGKADGLMAKFYAGSANEARVVRG